MAKRLQVLLDEREHRDLQRAAKARQMTLAEWVRQALRVARQREPLGDAGDKLDAIRRASRHAFPTADVDRMTEEIERGYGGLPVP